MKANLKNEGNVKYVAPQTEFSLLSSIQALLEGSAEIQDLTEISEEW